MVFMKIGLPKALLYHYYAPLWKAFFDELKVHYIESEDTTSKTVLLGKEKSIDEACLALKIYFSTKNLLFKKDRTSLYQF